MGNSVKKEIERKIIEALKSAVVGLTTSDLATRLKVSRLTVMKYLQALKGRGIIIDKQVGAYKLWMLKENIEAKRRLISRKLACILAEVFIEIFGEKTEEIAFSVGKELAKKYIAKYPEDYEILKEVETESFEKIATVIEFISEELTVEGFSLDEKRGVIRIRGVLCDDERVSNILLVLITGAIIGFLEFELGISMEVKNTRISKREKMLDVILELGPKES